MHRRTRAIYALIAPVVVLTATLVPASIASADDTSTANQFLAQLTVAPADSTGYNRSLFPLWIDADQDGCDTRSEVLQEESLVPVTYSSGCTVATGQWASQYDDLVWTNASDVDIDHLVPLGEAWASGARNWTTAQRQAFANDLDIPYALIAVTDNVNQSKGDRDPAQWLPSKADYVCDYVTAWVKVKWRWSLTIDQAEKNAVTAQLNTNGCGDGVTDIPARMIAPSDPVTTVTLPTVAATNACTSNGGTISASGGSGVTTRVLDAQYQPVADPQHLAAGQYQVEAAVNDGQHLRESDLPTGWTAGDGEGNYVFHALYAVTVGPAASCPQASPDTLVSGATLAAGGSLIATGNGFHLDMQGDGNAVAYRADGRVFWQTGTSGNPGAKLVMQGDGNLVVVSNSGRALWDSHTSGRPGSLLRMQGDGNVVVYFGSVPTYNGFAAQPPGPDPSEYRILSGAQMPPGSYLHYGSWKAVMQGDGNFVVYNGSAPAWSSRSSGYPNGYLYLQPDGNLVIYKASSFDPLWTTRSSGSGNYLQIQGDGNVVLYRGDGAVLWNRFNDTSYLVPQATPGGGGGGGTPPPSDPPQQGVTPGAFCAPAGAIGYTSTGRRMVCTTTATDSRNRWRAA